MTENKKFPLWRRFCALLIVLVFTLTAIMSVSALLLQRVILSPAYYATHVITNAYAEEMKTLIDNSLQLDCVVYTFPYEEVTSAITTETILQLSKDYVFNIVYAMIHQTEVLKPEFPMEDIAVCVESYAQNAENPGLFASESNRTLLVEKLEERINEMLEVLAHQTITQTLSSVLFGNPLFQRYASLAPLFLTIFLLSGILGVLFCAQGLPARLYTMASAFWIAATVCFVPFLLLKHLNLVTRIALGASPLRTFVVSMLSSVLHTSFAATGIMFVIATLLLIASAYYFARHLHDEASS